MIKEASPAQMRMIALMACSLPVDYNEVSKAMKSSGNAFKFIKKHKGEFDEAVQDKLFKKEPDPIVSEESVIRDVRLGRCPDHVATIRGEAIAQVLCLQPVVPGKFSTDEGTRSLAGLYRTVIGAIIEAKDFPTTEIKFCAACQLELSVDPYDEACPRCGSKLAEINQGD